MIKAISLLILLSVTLVAQINFNPYHTTIKALGKNSVVVTDSATIAIGSTGVIMQSFEGNHKTIIASVEVVKKEAGNMVLALKTFKAVEQEALPAYSIAPKVGDKVILNFLYNRAIAITPSEESYKIVTKSYDDFIWVHPDILAAKLLTAYNPTPSKETLQETCIENNIGLLMFAVADKGHFVDCNSFQTLQTIPLPVSATVKSPFYNRLEKIKGRVFGIFGGKGVNDYDAFYTKLLK